MSIGKILCYIRVYSIHISQKTFNFAAENDNNIKLWKKQRDALIVAKKLSNKFRYARTPKGLENRIVPSYFIQLLQPLHSDTTSASFSQRNCLI